MDLQLLLLDHNHPNSVYLIWTGFYSSNGGEIGNGGGNNAFDIVNGGNFYIQWSATVDNVDGVIAYIGWDLGVTTNLKWNMGGPVTTATTTNLRTFSMGWSGYMAPGEDTSVMTYDLSGVGNATMKNYVAYIIKVD